MVLFFPRYCSRRSLNTVEHGNLSYSCSDIAGLLLVHKHRAFISHKHENLALNMVILIYLWNMSIESHSLTADVGLYLEW